MIGQTIDRYRVVEKLGQGEMGVVYKARDTVLDRFVALKVLPPDKSSDPDRRRRFLQEAKSASALNHPGIVLVHDVLTVDGQDVLVMELVDGETLDGVLARRRLPLGEALGLGARIADALARERVILGTIGWMSPEQASGRPVDARSDIFAFGVLLYEMLTGRHPFRRATTTETLAAIREQDPEPPTRLVPTLPPEVDRVVMRCLRKEPAKRWQSLSDLGIVLQDIKEDSESGRRVIVDAGRLQRRRGRRQWAAAAAVGALAVVAATALVFLRRPPPEAVPLDMRRLTYDGGYSASPAISSDGKLVAYASDRAGDGQTDIWVRHINRPEPARLTDGPADEWQPRFSPDGSRVVYHSERDGGGIWVVGTFGGEPRKLASRGFFPRFSPDGNLVAYMELLAFSPTGLAPMFTVPVNGGEPKPFLPAFGATRPPHGIGPIWSPDGARVLFKGAPFDDPAKRDWWVAPVDGGAPVSSGGRETLPRIDSVQFPCAWVPGRLLFLAGTTIEGVNLYGAPMSREGRIEGPVETLTSGPCMMWSPSVSADGRIALSKFQWVIHLWQTELDPNTGRAVGPPARLTDDATPKFGFSLPRDGSQLAFSSYSGPKEKRRTEVRLRDLENGQEKVLVSQSGQLLVSLFPRLSGDGSLLAWTGFADRQRASWVAPVADPTGVELCRDCSPIGFFTAGDALVWQAPNGLVRHRLADGFETVVLEPAELEIIDADPSRDDSWLAVSAGKPDGSVTIFIIPVRDPPPLPAEWIEIEDGSHWVGSPRWSDNGRLLYYLSDRDDFTCIWARPLDPATKRPAGDPFPVIHAHRDTMKMFGPIKGAFTMAIGGRRLVFNASEMTGEI